MTAHLFDRPPPYDFGDPDEEARACRESAALFDFSFVRRARLRGPGALALLEAFGGRPLRDLPPGRLRFALRRDPEGLLLSDLTLWNLGEAGFEVMTGRPEDIADLAGAVGPGCEPGRELELRDLSGETAIFSLQGPASLRALEGLAGGEALARDLADLAFFEQREIAVAGLPCRVARLGYSGEAGIELILDKRLGETLWERLAGVARPAGLAALDRLRIEAGLALFCNEFAPGVTAAEAGLERYLAPAGAPPRVRLVSFQAESGPSTRPLLWRPNPKVAQKVVLPTRAGEITVTSACWSPPAGGFLGLGYVLPEAARPGRPVSDLSVNDLSGAFQGIRLAPLPFLASSRERPRRGWVRT